MKKKLVVLTGAGISAESGIRTFRDSDGLWEGHDVMEVASPEGWRKNPALVLDFYNKRRQQLKEVQPNAAHFILAELEKDFEVHIITQNVDNLHEKAGSTNVLHLHGELLKARGVADFDIMDWEEDIYLGTTGQHGQQLRPHIVWFGEEVPALAEAVDLTSKADLFAVVGTSLQVYPAAGLIEFTMPHIPMFYIDPKPAKTALPENRIETIPLPATQGMVLLREKLQEFL